MWTSNPQIWILWLCVMGISQALFCLHPAFVKFLSERVQAKGLLSRAVVAVFVGQLTFSAVSKSGAPSNQLVAQFVTALYGGGIVDESGLVAKASEAAVLEAYTQWSAEIVGAASGTVSRASAAFTEVAQLVTNSERQVIYIASDLPRAYARGWTNHNIAATVERVRQSAGGETLSMWVWFSEEPSVAPGMCAEIDLGAGFFKLPAVTNSYPETESVNGVPCVRYDYEVRPMWRGVVLRPEYEVGFGHPDAPLLVPVGGVAVQTGGVTRLPFTGTDGYFSGRAAVTYRGGIAVGLEIDGAAVTNGVYEL